MWIHAMECHVSFWLNRAHDTIEFMICQYTKTCSVMYKFIIIFMHVDAEVNSPREKILHNATIWFKHEKGTELRLILLCALGKFTASIVESSPNFKASRKLSWIE